MTEREYSLTEALGAIRSAKGCFDWIFFGDWHNADSRELNKLRNATIRNLVRLDELVVAEIGELDHGDDDE